MYQLPGGVDNHILFYQYGLLDILREAYAKNNVYYVSPLVYDPVDMVSKKEVHSLADVKKLKVRASGVNADVLAKLGIATTSIPWSEVYTALSTGVIDAAVLFGAQAYLDYKYNEVVKYLLTPSMSSNLLNNFLFNMKKWQSLPADVKALIELACREFSYWNSQDMAKTEFDSRAKMQQLGMKIIELDPAFVKSLEKTSLEYMDAYAAKNPVSAKAIERVKAWWKTQGRL